MEKQEIFESYKKTFAIINKKLKTCKNQKEMYELLFDGYELLLNFQKDLEFENKQYRNYAMNESTILHTCAGKMAATTGSGKADEIHWKLLLFEAPHVLDSYCRYIEKNRKPEEKFYEPRRKTLKKVVDKLQALEDDELDELFLHQPGRTGKALPLDEDVLTPDGFVKMRDITVGSKVISGNGTVCNVIGVYPQGKKDVYRINFSDGTSVECCKEHLWKVQTIDDRRKDRRGHENYRVIPLEKMIKSLTRRNGKESNYSVDFVKPVQFSKKDLKIPAYVIGVILGDGNLTDGTPIISNPEYEIYEKVKSLCSNKYEVNYIKSKNRCQRFSIKGMSEEIKELGLFGRRSHEKHIPSNYLYSSVEDRLELLRGLCDTDGSVSKGEFIDYSTASEQLANDIVFLARSLGGRATFRKSGLHYTTKAGEKVECKYRYRITLSLNGLFVPVSSEKHLKKYYANKRVTKKFIKSIEYSRKCECQCIEVDDPSHLYVTRDFIVTHNTQIITMGTSWHCARNPEKSNLYVTYKEGLGGAYLDGVTEIWTDPTYCFTDVFPYIKIARTDAKNHKVDLVKKKKYATLSGKGMESGLNGEYDAYGWLILDDILEGIQDVLNPDISQRKQIILDNNVMSRKKEQCKIIWNGTIWSLHDLYMDRRAFLENNPEAKNIRWDILKLPALDPETDESNFDYDYGVGYSTKYYRTIRAKFEENNDMAGWFAQYQQEPIERDGAVFSPENMPNRYDGNLPEEAPLKVVSACDVALGGMDYLAMPIAYVYEDGRVYIHDVVYDNSEKKITQPKVVAKIIENGVTNAFFEANAGGEGYKDDIDKFLKEKGVKINLVSKFTQQILTNSGKGWRKTSQSKVQRIWDNAETIRQFYFREPGCQSLEYRKFMNNLYSFTVTGKNKNDDGADAAAMLAVFINKGSGVKPTRIINSPI